MPIFGDMVSNHFHKLCHFDCTVKWREGPAITSFDDRSIGWPGTFVIGPSILSSWPTLSWQIRPFLEYAVVSLVLPVSSADICAQQPKLFGRLPASLTSAPKNCCDPTTSSDFCVRPARFACQGISAAIQQPRMPLCRKLEVFVEVCLPNHAHNELLQRHVEAVGPTTSVNSCSANAESVYSRTHALAVALEVLQW